MRGFRDASAAPGLPQSSAKAPSKLPQCSPVSSRRRARSELGPEWLLAVHCWLSAVDCWLVLVGLVGCWLLVGFLVGVKGGRKRCLPEILSSVPREVGFRDRETGKIRNSLCFYTSLYIFPHLLSRPGPPNQGFGEIW